MEKLEKWGVVLVEGGPRWSALVFWITEVLWDALSSNSLHCLQNISDMCQVDAEERTDYLKSISLDALTINKLAVGFYQ